jgi:hypothetical protein
MTRLIAGGMTAYAVIHAYKDRHKIRWQREFMRVWARHYFQMHGYEALYGTIFIEKKWEPYPHYAPVHPNQVHPV